MTKCDQCGMQEWIVKETRMTVRGERRRRLQCNVCSHRWTVFTEENEGRPYQSKWDTQAGRSDAWRRLSREDARAIIQSELPQRELATIYGITRQAISLIQTGLRYKDVYWELHPPRVGPLRHCVECLHWSNGVCGFGFPEAGDEFANECTVFLASVTPLSTKTDYANCA